ncbi:oxidoreductase, NAD-binding domain protein [Prevotella sp. BV3P1]|uniref:Gfo/Idh/MocA family protein n=1 Tax=Prevotellaceae TaxID=171552 RepID=UPI0003B84191|nr:MULTISPECIES: Gfo/Idh/MocA family oxidoreductase [Prevotellaceae]ERT60455.1 oxidoreductase, NAD-binding domain protein [Prevotella sp. BV3P1]KGF39443.1 hypothetical protein HMPREF2140_10085 [Hoylesella buccalis DNF00985]
MNIGIIGTGKIVNEMIPVVQQINGITIQAICSRPQSLSKAERLAALFHIKEVYNDYDAMLHKSDIDFVYVAVANHAHASYARRALLAKKNVIIEKPICTSVAELEELMQLAFANNLYIFEAVTLLHMPHYQLIKNELLAQLGRVKLIECNYSQRSSRYDLYLNHQLTPAFDTTCHGGALMDINVYNINFVLSLFGVPIRVEYHPNVGYNKIDTSGVAILTYPDFVAICIGAKDCDGHSFGAIQGDEGRIYVTGPVSTLSELELCKDGKQKTVNIQPKKHRLAFEFEHFRDIYHSHQVHEMKHYLQISHHVMKVIDQLRGNTLSY